MRASFCFGIALMGLVLVPAACGDSEGTGGTGGAGAGGSPATTVVGPQGSTSGMSTTTGMPPVCDGSIWGSTCGSCLEQQCCQELEDSDGMWSEDLEACAVSCGADCTVVFEGPECSAPTTLPARGACVTMTGAHECNPVTQEGCDVAAGEACDKGTAGFVCYPDNNEHTACEGCGDDGIYCVAGYGCLEQCAKYCCDDADCGPGTCRKGIFFIEPALGLCETDGNEGGGGGGGAGPGGGGPGGGGSGGAGGAGGA
ncbi:MAG: hypothetical protein JNL21_08275 [Myxococcales bacterium]|nr:hypothetical protein [Myxococcales bacterium]